MAGLALDEFFGRADETGTVALLPDALGLTVALVDGAGAVSTETRTSLRAGGALTLATVWPYHAGMATQTIKTTYALDVETVRTLERIARRWGVSRSEALRRAIRVAARDAGPASDAIGARDALQRSLGLSATVTRAWASRVRAERRASARRRQTR